jgi:hypothetical protein
MQPADSPNLAFLVHDDGDCYHPVPHALCQDLAYVLSDRKPLTTQEADASTDVEPKVSRRQCSKLLRTQYEADPLLCASSRCGLAGLVLDPNLDL